MTFHVTLLLSRRFTWSHKSDFLLKYTKKNICRLLQILLGALTILTIIACQKQVIKLFSKRLNRDFFWKHSWVASSERAPSNLRKMRRFRSSCAWAKYHPGLCSPFIHFIVYYNSGSRQWRPWSDCVDAQADLGLRCRHMPEGTFLHGPAHVYSRMNCWSWKYFKRPNICLLSFAQRNISLQSWTANLHILWQRFSNSECRDTWEWYQKYDMDRYVSNVSSQANNGGSD